MQLVTFRPSKSFGGQYIEADTLADVQLQLRQYLTAGSFYRAIKEAGNDFYTVLYMSDYIQGPSIAGYMRIYS